MAAASSRPPPSVQLRARQIASDDTRRRMRTLPAGTVTLLFTDIVGSTRLLEQLGERYADALFDHRRVLRAAFARHRGIEVDTQGDAFFAVFEKASDAVAAAAEIQASLADDE